MTRARVYAERTDVPVERSKTEIERMLTQAGATQFATLAGQDRVAIAFTLGGRNYRFVVELPQFSRAVPAHISRGYVSVDQRKRQRFRALALVIKAKLEAGRSGITSLETELLPYAVLPGGRTVADEALPALAQAYESGRDVPLLPGV
jgi:hypothetical protein